MNILINLKKNNIQNQLFSVKVILIQNKRIREYRNIFDTTNVIIKTGIEFIENEKYDFIISVVCLGKQIIKEKYTFIYKKNTMKFINDEYIDIEVRDDNETNNIVPVMHLTYESYKNYNYKINPVAMYRKDKDDLSTVFLNDNIYILKGNLMKIVEKIYCNSEFKKLIDKNKELDNINLLILKGCLICYE